MQQPQGQQLQMQALRPEPMQPQLAQPPPLVQGGRMRFSARQDLAQRRHQAARHRGGGLHRHLLPQHHPHRRLEAVITLHAPDGYGYCKGCPSSDNTPRWDDCPTIAAIKGDQ